MSDATTIREWVVTVEAFGHIRVDRYRAPSEAEAIKKAFRAAGLHVRCRRRDVDVVEVVR